MARRPLLACLLALSAFGPGIASAQDATDQDEEGFVGEAVPTEDETAATPPPAEEPADTTGTGRLSDEQALHEERTGTETVRDSSDPFEDPEEGYWFLGAFYRQIFVPEFLLNLFLDESTAGINPAFGVEVTYRKDGFNLTGQVWWAGYSAEGPVRASGDPETDVEFIDAGTSLLVVSGSFMWSTAFNDVFALEYGVDLGLGFVLGDIVRTEAYPDDGAGSVNGYSACNGVNDPSSAPAGYCDGPSVGDGETGAHYGVKARNWADGGSVPIVVPWLAIPHIALRIKPIHQVQIRIDGGFGLGFFLGAGVAYGF